MEYNGYIIQFGKYSSQHIIKHTGKGSLPKALSGCFTSQALAKKAIDEYLKSKQG